MKNSSARGSAVALRAFALLAHFWWLVALSLGATGAYLIVRHQTHWVVATVLVLITFLLGTLLPFVAGSGRLTRYRQQGGRIVSSLFVASEFALRLATAAIWLWAVGVVAYLSERVGGLDAVLGSLLFVGVTMFLGALAGLAIGPLSAVRTLTGPLGQLAPNNFLSRFLRRVLVIYFGGVLAWSAIMIVVIEGKI